MTEIITYSLRAGEKLSDQYYKDISTFTEQVLSEARERIYSIIVDFQDYVQESAKESLRSKDEYLFEFLTLGVLWNTYANNSFESNNGSNRLLATLAKYRKRNNYLKPVIDFMRGILATLFLLPQSKNGCKAPAPTMENLNRLLSWLTATDDFSEEVKRLQTWQEFISSQENETAQIIGASTALADWFQTRSLDILGRYTPNVDEFLTQKHPAYRWREDVVFCGRLRVEYHLNMVGTEILNRAFRSEFLKTDRKVVFVPPCMKAKPEGECKAQATPMGEHCAACTPGCQVHQATKLGEKHGFDVFIIPDELSVLSDKKIEPQENTLGLVGISCPLTNMKGGWETRRMGIPAQGVLLDYCGCPWHWHKDGITTDINFNTLMQVLGINNKQSRETKSQDCKIEYTLPV